MKIKRQVLLYLHKKKNLLLQIGRYGIVGGISTAIHYGTYLLLLWVIGKTGLNQTANANISYAGGYFVGFCFNYFLTTYFTFKTKASKKNATGFTVCHIINYLLEMGVLNLLLFWGLERSMAGLIVIVVAVPINFVMLKIAYYLSGKK